MIPGGNHKCCRVRMNKRFRSRRSLMEMRLAVMRDAEHVKKKWHYGLLPQ
jgi:hypothetical protein